MAEASEPVLEMPVEDLDLGSRVELEYAGFWSRVAALIIDDAVITIFGLALLIAAGSIGAGAVLIANFALILVMLLYWPLMESSERQATLGKQLLGIQVTDENGARLSFVRALLRNLAKFISSLPFGLGYLLAAFTAKKQALHDMITKCLVVRAGPSNFRKAVIAVVGALVIMIGGGYYYFTEVYLPQMAQDMGRSMEKGMKQAQRRLPAAKPAPSQPPVAQAPAPAPQPAPAATKPGEPKPMTPQEIAEFEKKMEMAKSEPAKVAVATPPAKPGAAEAKPAPAKPVPAPVSKETTSKPAEAPAKPAPAAKKPALAAAPAAQPKPETKPAAVPAVKPEPVPEPAPAPEKPAALVSEAPSPPPADEPRAPAAAPPVVVPPVSTRVITPKYNDVMTAVMYHDLAAATQLLDLGWWVDRPDSNRVTPLMAAAWLGDVEMTQLLLKAGADPNLYGPGGSVLKYADRGGDGRVIELLRKSGAR
jgi:uncharacterized RDD family membrane protein YckC